MSFPTTETDTFESKVDRHSGSVVSGESHTVPLSAPYTVELDELPQVGTVAIVGYTEVAYLPTAGTEFYVDYGTATITFHSSVAGTAINIDYTALGSVLRASDVNELHEALQRTQAEIFAMLQGPIAALRVVANSETTPTSSVLVRGGTYYGLPRMPITISSVVLDFASGSWQLDAITAGKSVELLITADYTGLLHVYVGDEADTPAEATFAITQTFADAHDQEVWLAKVVVTDDGSGVAGSINTIAKSDITDLRQGIYGGQLLSQIPNYTTLTYTFRLRSVTTGAYFPIYLTGAAGVEAFVIDPSTTPDGDYSPTVHFNLVNDGDHVELWNVTQGAYQRIELHEDGAGTSYLDIRPVADPAPAFPTARIYEGVQIQLLDRESDTDWYRLDAKYGESSPVLTWSPSA